MTHTVTPQSINQMYIIRQTSSLVPKLPVASYISILIIPYKWMLKVKILVISIH